MSIHGDLIKPLDELMEKYYSAGLWEDSILEEYHKKFQEAGDLQMADKLREVIEDARNSAHVGPIGHSYLTQRLKGLLYRRRNEDEESTL